MTGSDVASRRRGREAALQMLYQSEIGRTDLAEVIEHYWDTREPDERLSGPLQAFANALADGTRERLAEIDGLLQAHAENWRLARMAVIDRLVLRLAAYELLASSDTPARVVINEAIELARTFSTEESVGFVNGILDAVRRAIGRE
jgi:transcription antitermination protein NusB